MQLPDLISATAMLRAVAAGIDYGHIAAAHGVTKSTVSTRVRRLAHALQRIVGVIDVDEDASPTAHLLRSHQPAYLEALEHFHPNAAPALNRHPAILTPAHIDMLLRKIDRHSHAPLRDRALLLLLFTTGAKPLEIAQLAVRDYLDLAGHVRRASILRAAIASNGADRPFPFDCERTSAAIDDYLQERLAHNWGTSGTSGYRGLDPAGRLFLSRDGRPMLIGHPEGRQVICKEIHDIYRRIFMHGGLSGVNTICARRMAALRLWRNGATTREIGQALGLRQTAVVKLLKPAFEERTPGRTTRTMYPGSSGLASARADGNMESTSVPHRRRLA